MSNNREGIVEVKSVFPKRRQDVFAEDSWGYKNCFFEYIAKDKALFFRGKQYPETDSLPFSYARDVLKQNFYYDIAELKCLPSNNKIKEDSVKFYDNIKFRERVIAAGIDYSLETEDRFFRCHSQASRDFYILKHSQFKRIPDIVIWPKCHEEVETIVKLANELNVVIIPAGGLTNITCANNCPEDETRMIVSLDMTQMNRMLWLDKNSMLACFETGIAGQDLERTLQERGLILGHEPDSIEFSTLGGWIATRSSGIKQQAYGNIEDIVVSTKTVTSMGVLQKSFIAPRVSMGPELEHIILGSEGTLGVITEAIVRVHNLPKFQRYGSIAFYDFPSGIKCFRECSQNKVLPSSLRLMDNMHVQFGLAHMFNKSFFGHISDRIKKSVLTNVLGYDESQYALAVYLFEGDSKNFVESQEENFAEIVKNNGGLMIGEKFGKRGYLLTYTIGYSRDMVFRLGGLGDSIETSISWDKCESCIDNVRNFYSAEMRRLELKGTMAFRISQVYHEGVCIYLYYIINKCENQLTIFDNMGSLLKDVVKKSGGSLSHHHGIGKKNALKFSKDLSNVAKEMLRSLKEKIDPNNIFAAGNLIYDDKISSKL